MTRWFRDNGLTIALMALFAVSLVGQAAMGWKADNAERIAHHMGALGLAAYLASGAFLSALFENQNWQSEFLSTAVLIVLAIFLRERGSPESKAVGDPHGKTGTD